MLSGIRTKLYHGIGLFFNKIEHFKYINQVLIVSAVTSILSGGALYYVDNEAASLNDALTQKNRSSGSTLILLKGSNVPQIREWLIELSKVYVRGLWLTSIHYLDDKYTIEINAKAEDQGDIYKYTSMLSGALREKKFCLTETEIFKKGERAESSGGGGSGKPLPFVLAFLAQKKVADEKKEVAREDAKIKENPEDALRWVYNYDATLKYGKCF